MTIQNLGQKALGSVLIILAGILITEYLQESEQASVVYLLNILILLAFGFRCLFYNSKKTTAINGDTLIIKRNRKILKQISLASVKRISKGIGSIKIYTYDFQEIFVYSEFDRRSVRKLKSLNAKLSFVK